MKIFYWVYRFFRLKSAPYQIRLTEFSKNSYVDVVFIAFFAYRALKSYQNQLIQLANPHEIPMTNNFEHNWTKFFAINRLIVSSLSHLPDALKTLNSRIIFCYHFSFSTYIHFCNLPLILPAGINLLQFFLTCFCIPLCFFFWFYYIFQEFI